MFWGLSVCLPVCLSVCLSVSLSLSLSLCLCLSLSLSSFLLLLGCLFLSSLLSFFTHNHSPVRSDNAVARRGRRKTNPQLPRDKHQRYSDIDRHCFFKGRNRIIDTTSGEGGSVTCRTMLIINGLTPRGSLGTAGASKGSAARCPLLDHCYKMPRPHDFTGHGQLPSQTRHSKTEATKSSQWLRERRVRSDWGNEEFEGTKNSQRQKERRDRSDWGNEEFEGKKNSQRQRERRVRRDSESETELWGQTKTLCMITREV